MWQLCSANAICWFWGANVEQTAFWEQLRTWQTGIWVGSTHSCVGLQTFALAPASYALHKVSSTVLCGSFQPRSSVEGRRPCFRVRTWCKLMFSQILIFIISFSNDISGSWVFPGVIFTDTTSSFKRQMTLFGLQVLHSQDKWGSCTVRKKRFHWLHQARCSGRTHLSVLLTGSTESEKSNNKEEQ